MVNRVMTHVLRYLETVKDEKNNKRVLIMGASFKPNVKDVRNSKPVELAKLLKQNNVEVELIDPLVDTQQLERVAGLTLTSQIKGRYQVIIVAVNHTAYKELGESYFCNSTSETALVIDLTGAFKGVIHNRKYWTI
jgi:UDP-N-acetyl-D-galactosamine dehydrogenase